VPYGAVVEGMGEFGAVEGGICLGGGQESAVRAAVECVGWAEPPLRAEGARAVRNGAVTGHSYGELGVMMGRFLVIFLGEA